MHRWAIDNTGWYTDILSGEQNFSTYKRRYQSIKLCLKFPLFHYAKWIASPDVNVENDHIQNITGDSNDDSYNRMEVEEQNFEKYAADLVAKSLQA